MAANYVLLETITVGAAGAASVVFNNIPQSGYTDLVIKASARSNKSGSTDYMKIEFNGSSANLTSKTLWGSGSSTGSYSSTAIIPVFDGNTATSSTFGNMEIYVPNYTSANFKSVSIDTVDENNATGASMGFDAGLWSSTAAITSVTLTPRDGTLILQYSTFSLYGIAAVGTTPTIAPKATGGDIIQTDGTYWYHAFLSSGTFTPAVGLTCDVLQVAGGGGGGSRSGGGGGAGGISYLTSQSILASAQAVTVGAGGTGGSRSVNGTNGTNSVFASLTAAVGGGFGASAVGAQVSGGAGGSGGGGSNGAGGVGGSATSGQGFAGGSSNVNSFDAGGGGGAGAVGANASTGGAGSGSGAGGAGVNTYSTWASTTGTGVSGYYAGGGGGGSYGSSNHGAGGAGGGGNGADTSPTAGIANTGGGGGGSGNSANTNTTPVGANGGSGVVIIRYPIA